MNILVGLFSLLFILSIPLQIFCAPGQVKIVAKSCSTIQIQYLQIVRQMAWHATSSTTIYLKKYVGEALKTFLVSLPENEEERDNVIDRTLGSLTIAFREEFVNIDVPEEDEMTLNVVCGNNPSSPERLPITVTNSPEGNFLHLGSPFFGNGLRSTTDMESKDYLHELPFVSFLQFGPRNSVFALIRAGLLSSPIMGGVQNVLVGISSQKSFEDINTLSGIRHADAWAVVCFLWMADVQRLMFDRKIKMSPDAVISHKVPSPAKVRLHRPNWYLPDAPNVTKAPWHPTRVSEGDIAHPVVNKVTVHGGYQASGVAKHSRVWGLVKKLRPKILRA